MVINVNNKSCFSCVLDYSSLMAIQTYIWLVNLLANGVNSKQIYVHVVGKIPAEFSDYLITRGVNIIKKSPFDVRNKYCNKLVQLETFVQLENYDYVFLMDCDTAVIDLKDLNLTEDVYAKVVDFPNPPLTILQDVYAKSNLEIFQTETTFSLNGEQLTDWNNCNGGLYIIAKDFLNVLAPKWVLYSKWCIEHKQLFTDAYSKHADQVGFALALTSLNKRVTHLGIEWNYPIHVKTNVDVKPRIIHFHDCIDTQIKLKRFRLQEVDNSIDIVNKRISNSIRSGHLNSIFWDFRYAFFPELGSGIGSRGDTLKYKRELLSNSFKGLDKFTVLDVGCGDLEVINVFSFKEYLGLDLSSEAIKKGKIKRPIWNFKLIRNSNFESENKDVVICLDVLIHQKNFSDYLDLFNSLVKHVDKRLIVAAYDEKPKFSSDITFFHEPISLSLKKTGLFKSVYKIGEYNNTAFIVADKFCSNYPKPKKIVLKKLDRKNTLYGKIIKYIKNR